MFAKPGDNQLKKFRLPKGEGGNARHPKRPLGAVTGRKVEAPGATIDGDEVKLEISAAFMKN